MPGFLALRRFFTRGRAAAALTSPSAAQAGMGLGIAGLPPPLVRFPPGQVQVLLAPEPEARLALVAQVLTHALARRVRLCVVLGPTAGAAFETCLAAVPALGAAVQSGQLRLLEWVPHQGDARAPEALLAELGLFQVAPEDGLVFLGTEALFAWECPQVLHRQLMALRAKVRQRPAGALFFFSGQCGEALAVEGRDDVFANVARLVSVRGLLTLEILRWQGGLQNCCYGLHQGEGGLELEGSVIDTARQRLRAAPRQGCVLAMAAALAGQTGVPEHWQILADAAALEAELPTLGAATLLLAYEGPATFMDLVRWVHRLRLAHPRHLKILVRETGAKLRYGAEAILFKAGVSGVIYRELGFSRVIQQVHAQSSQIYQGEPLADLDELLAAAEPPPVSGYLPPERFCRQVREMVERSAVLGIEHCLLRLPLLRRVTHRDALAQCRVGRHGDVVSADREGLYLFLFACREPDVAASLARIFAEPVDTLFESMSILPGDALILRSIDDLARQAEQEGLPDYSPLLAPRAVPVAAPVAGGSAADGDDTGRAAPLPLLRVGGAAVAAEMMPAPRQVWRFSLAEWRPLAEQAASA